MDSTEHVQRIADNLQRRAAINGDHVMGLIKDGFTGRSAAVTAYVNVLGQLQRLRIQRGTFREGDEPLIADAVLEAIQAARHSVVETVHPEPPTSDRPPSLAQPPAPRGATRTGPTSHCPF